MARFALDSRYFKVRPPTFGDQPAAPEFVAMELTIKSLGVEIIDISGAYFTFKVPSLQVFTFLARLKKLKWRGEEVDDKGAYKGQIENLNRW
jgi:hypothetical protein